MSDNLDDPYGLNNAGVSADPTSIEDDPYKLGSSATVTPTIQQSTSVKRSPFMDAVLVPVVGTTNLVGTLAAARLTAGGHAGGENLDEPHFGGTEDYVGQFANWLVVNKEKLEKKYPYIYGPVQDESYLRSKVREGAQMIVPSLGAGLPGAIAAGSVGGPVGAVAGFAGGGGTIFGLAQYDQVIRDVLKHNAENPESVIPPEIYRSEAFKQALIEGGFEAASNVIEGATFGLGKLATQPVKESIRSILKQGWKGSAKNYLAAQAKAQPAEVATEMAQNYLETQSNVDMGLPQSQTPWQAAVDSILPTITSVAITGGLFQGVDAKKRANIIKALENPETDFDTRFDAMRTVYTELQKTDKVNDTNIAQKWGEIAQYKLLEGEPIELDKKFTDMKPLEGVLADKEVAKQNDIDTNKFMGRGQPKVDAPEVIPEGEVKPEDDKVVRQTMGIELRQQLFDKFIEKGFGEEKANEMAAFIMGAKDPSILIPNTQPSVILDKDGIPIEKEVTQDSTSDTIKLTPGKSIIQNIPENLKNQFVFTSKGELFSNKGAVKAILKKQGLSETYAPMMLAQNEWVGAPIAMTQMAQNLGQVVAGNRRQPLIVTGQGKQEQGVTTQTPVQQTTPVETTDDLTNKGKPFTNKVSAKIAIQKNYKEMDYTGTEEKYVPVQIGDKQWVARRKELVPQQPKIESAQEYVTRRNNEYLTAKTPTEGLATLDNIIAGLEENGHEKTKVYQRTVSRRNAVAKTIEREQRKEQKVKEKNETKPVTETPVEATTETTQAKPEEVKVETQEVVSKEGGETNGQVQIETQVTPKEKVEKLRANTVEKRLKAGEDVTDEDVAKFKTLALRWTRNPETNKWEEHEPNYKVEQNKPALTEEEREARADQRAIAKAEKNPKKIVKKTPRELIKKSQSELKKLKAELAEAKTEQEREDLEYAIDSTRQDIKILANRLMAKKSSPKVQWFGEEDTGEEATKKEHPLAKHVSYMSPVMAQEQLDHYTEVEPDTGMRMLKKMSPVTMPRAFAAMINYAGHFSDGTVDLNMISKFIQQLEEGVKVGKLDNFFAPTENTDAGVYDEKQSFIQDVTVVKDLLQKTIDLGIVPQKSKGFQRTEGKGPGLSVKEVTDVSDKISELWPNSPYVIVLDNRDQLPPELKARIAGDAGNYDIGGAQLGDTVFLIRNELHNKFGVIRTMLHEAIGHYGIYKTLGTKFDSTALSIFDSFKDTEKMEKIIFDYKFDTGKEQDRIDAGAEYLAFMAEENLGTPTFWEKVKVAVNNILRDLGFDIKLNTIDLKLLLADSQKFLKGEIGASTNIEDYLSEKKIPRLDKVTNAPTFYSTLLQTVTTRTDMPTKPQSLINWLNKFVKPAEIKWMGVEQYLKGKTKVDKKDFENFLRANQIEVKEISHTADVNEALTQNNVFHDIEYEEETEGYIVTVRANGRIIGYENFGDEQAAEEYAQQVEDEYLSEPPVDNQVPTRHGQWVLPGGKNYKELLLIWNPGKPNDLQETLDAGGKPSDIYETLYTSTHWNEPDVLGHARINERTDDKGRSVLFIEEIQSDWLQDAKSKGFKEDWQLPNGWKTHKFEDIATLANVLENANLNYEVLDDEGSQRGIGTTEQDAINDAYTSYARENNIKIGVSKAPFLENWHEVLMKRMIRYATDNNFDAVAWTTGKQQADRYNLAKPVDELTVEKDSSGTYTIFGSKNGNSVVTKTNLSEDDLVSNMGQDLTTKAVDSLSRGSNRKTFVGLDLEIGGKGMKVFYDEKLKNFTEKYIKQWGAKLETLNLGKGKKELQFENVGDTFNDEWNADAGSNTYNITKDDNREKYNVNLWLDNDPDNETFIGVFDDLYTAKQEAQSHFIQSQEIENLQQPGFTVTAEMAKSVVEKGQPWFRKTNTPQTTQQEPRGRFRIVDYADITPDTPKQELKNLFDDQAYAMLKTMVMQLPKNQPAMHWAERYLMSPEWYKHPTMQKIVRAAIDRHDRYFELFNLLNEMEINPETMKQRTWENSSDIIEANMKLMHRGLTTAQILKGETSKEYKQLEKMKDQIDTGEWKKGYEENVPTWEQHFQTEGVGQDVITLYKAHRRAYDVALDILMEPMRKLVANIEKQAEKDGTKPKYPEFVTLNEDGKPETINLKAVLARMGTLKGSYAPRLRETGDYVVKGKRFDKVVRYHKSNRFAAELLKRELERKGYKVEEIFERERLPEDVYASLRIINTQQAIKTAMQRIEGIDPELEIKFNEELLKEVADLIRVRGFRASMVTRKPGDAIRGYITDPNERFVRYINNISAGIAKGEAAKDMFETLAGHYEGTGKDKKLIGGIDPAKEPRAYDTATKYIEEQLRNSDAADRLVGLIKSLASFKYLGFNLRSPVVNILSLATTVPTAIHQYGLDGKGSMTKIMGAISVASNDYRKVMLGHALDDKNEQALIDEIKHRGYDTPQYTRDALGTIQRAHGKVWAKTMATAMYIFGKSEQWIRGTTMLAAYRLAKSANPDADNHELIRKAHDVSDKAHGIYGKSTQLAVGQGTGPAARLSQILYTFGKFPHNYLQMLYDTGVRKGNIKAFLYGLISPVILGGATVIPMKNLLFGIVGVMFKAMGDDDDPEKGFWDWIRKKLGKTPERIGRHGLLGAANLDVSGSMAIGVGTPRNFYELFGVGGGLYKDVEDAMHFLKIGQPGRAAEKVLPTGFANAFRAIRELNGVTTTKGQRVWDDSGKPYIPSTMETAARLVGFRSAEQATMGERTWETKREIARYKLRHDKILEMWRDYIIDKGSGKDMQRIMDQISDYNNSIMKSKKAGQIPFITNQTLKTQAKALYKPSRSMYMGMFNE